jgi:hypothetical protein
MAGAAASDTSGEKIGRPVVDRFGPAIAALNFNIWPDVLMTAGSDGMPHWQRLGLTRDELMFVIVLMRFYRSHSDWPSVSREAMASWLGMSSRQVQRLKNDLIADRYLARVLRYDRTERRSDALDLSPLLGLLEACVFLHHGDRVTRDIEPMWQTGGPQRKPLDPDAFGAARLARARDRATGRSERTRSSEGSGDGVIHNRGDAGDSPGGDVDVSPKGDAGVSPREDVHVSLPRDTGVSLNRAGEQRTGTDTPETEQSETAHLDHRVVAASRPDGRQDQTEPGRQDDELASRQGYYDSGIAEYVETWGAELSDDDPKRSLERAHRLWWNSGLSRDAYHLAMKRAWYATSARLRQGRILRGPPEQPQAMGYFFAVLEGAIADECVSRGVPVPGRGRSKHSDSARAS